MTGSICPCGWRRKRPIPPCALFWLTNAMQMWYTLMGCSYSRRNSDTAMSMTPMGTSSASRTCRRRTPPMNTPTTTSPRSPCPAGPSRPTPTTALPQCKHGHQPGGGGLQLHLRHLRQQHQGGGGRQQAAGWKV